MRQRGFRSPWGCWAEWLRGGRAGGELGEGGYASPAGKLIRPAVAGVWGWERDARLQGCGGGTGLATDHMWGEEVP